jgi:phenylacetate-coenzyme A ligase PaaK-like adenylate-forming protein
MKLDYQTLTARINALTAADFEATALAVFQYQYQNNVLYQQFVDLLRISPNSVNSLEAIPFLPIQFFKQHQIQTEVWAAEQVFSSSGTSQQVTSKHLIRDLSWYQQHALEAFEAVYGSLKDYVVLALLPSYLERQGSSLVFMVEQFIQRSQQKDSGFFLYDTQKLVQIIQACAQQQQPVLLLGVTYALLDLAEAHPHALEHTIVMETGGMKGQRAEQTKQAVHKQLKAAFQLPAIHSEYGMTELLSQAYSTGHGIFRPSRLMEVLVRETTDPLSYVANGRIGGLNIIDLANVATCSFIATDDLGRRHLDGTFEVLGRFDASDLRGCNLLVAES